MPIVLKKSVLSMVKEPAPTPLPCDIASLIEALGAEQAVAEAKMKRVKQLQTELKPYLERAKTLSELITAWAASQGIDPDDEFTMQSGVYMALVGKRGTERRVIAPELAMKRMGKKVFFEKVTLGLGVCDQYLTPEEKIGVIGMSRVLRAIKLVRRLSAATLH